MNKLEIIFGILSGIAAIVGILNPGVAFVSFLCADLLFTLMFLTRSILSYRRKNWHDFFLSILGIALALLVVWHGF